MAESDDAVRPSTSFHWPPCSSGSTFAQSLRLFTRAFCRNTKRSMAIAKPVAMMARLGKMNRPQSWKNLMIDSKEFMEISGKLDREKKRG